MRKKALPKIEPDVCPAEFAALPAGLVLVGRDHRIRKANRAGARRAEDALRESGEVLRLQIARMPLAHIVWDTDMRIRSWNPAAERIFGYTEQEVLGRRPFDLLVPRPLRRRLGAVSRRLLRGDTSAHSLNENLTKGGDTILCRWSNTPIRGRDGRVIGAFSMVEDVTLRMRAEEELRRREAAQAALLNATTEGVMLLDARGRVLCLNDALAARLGCAPEDCVGESAFDLIKPPAVARARRAHFRKVLRTGQPLRFVDERAGRTHDNHIYPSFDAAGRVAGVAVYTRDATAQVRAEAALRESEAKYRRLYESMRDAYGLVDLRGRLIEVNPAYCAMLGYSPAELLRMSYRDFTPPAWHAMEARIVREQVLRRGYSDVYEKEYRRRDGTVFPVELRTFLLRDDAGRPALMWAIVRDITERKQAERALQRARDELEDRVRDRTAQLRALAVQLNCAEERERRRIVEILHGDVQQTLAGVRYLLHSARRGTGTEANRRRLLRKADQHLLRAYEAMRSLCSDLFPPVLHEAGLGETLAWLRQDMRERFGLEVEVQADPAADPATDELRTFVFQAVRELLFNAAKHAGVRRARVAMKALDGERLQIAVRDRGVGFNAARTPSSGFGLFSLRERLDHMGGSLRIRTAPGRGAAIVMTLPRR